ncbi:MAG: DUF2138 family protein [Thiobacillus sp.]|nr:DUF2138 family protein [Thiobacillus sp.]
MSLHQRWAVVALAIGLGGVVGAAALKDPPPRKLTGLPSLTVDMARPDALIESDSLSALPAAVIQAPLLKDLLSEDFAFYYEDLDTRLDVSGAIKRLAYEHDLTLTDHLLDAVFDEPAEVAFWRGEGGRLRYWMLAGTRNGIAKSLQALAQVAADDTQLSHVADLGDPAATPVYALKLNSRHTLLFAARGDRLLVLSQPSLLLNESGELLPDRAAVALAALSDAGTPYGRDFAGAPRQGAHRLTVTANVLAQGYGQFMPAVQALRFERGAKAWSTGLKLDGRATLSTTLRALPWRALPEGAAFCAGLPVEPGELAGLADSAELKPYLTGAVAVCWYEAQGWQAPIFALRLSDAARADTLAPLLGRLFDQWIGAREFEQADRRFPVRAEIRKDGVRVWRREVSARYGELTVPAERRGEFSSDRYFDIGLALADDVVLFSPSGPLLDKGLDTLARRYPAMAERLPAAPALFTLDPPRLARFLEAATRDIGDEPGASLLPRYAAIAHHPAMAASLGGAAGTAGWLAVDWNPLK